MSRLGKRNTTRFYLTHTTTKQRAQHETLAAFRVSSRLCACTRLKGRTFTKTILDIGCVTHPHIWPWRDLRLTIIDLRRRRRERESWQHERSEHDVHFHRATLTYCIAMQVRRVLSLSIQAVHLMVSCFPHVLRMGLSAPRSCPTKEGPSRTERSSVIPCMACCSHSASPCHARSAVSLLKPSGCQDPEESGWERAFSEHRMVLLLRPFPLPSPVYPYPQVSHSRSP